MSNDKIGVALICCERPKMLEVSVQSLFGCIYDKKYEYVIVNDGREPLREYSNLINTAGRTGVAHAKNKGIQFLLNRGCEHIFLMEDDVKIIDYNVCEKYIETAQKTGIRHFNYGGHGNHNKNPDGSLNIRKTVRYPNGAIIDLYPNILGAFSYYHKSVFDKIGLMDEEFLNAMEHVYSSYIAHLEGFYTPFRWFADIHSSNCYLQDILPDHQESKIRSESNFAEVFQKGLDTFIRKTGFSVVQGYGPPERMVSEEEMLMVLKDLWNKRSEQ